MANRHADNYGIDARVTYFDKIPGTYITDVSLGVQLKATIKKGTETDTHIAYAFKGVDQYNKILPSIYNAKTIIYIKIYDSRLNRGALNIFLSKRSIFNPL